MDFLKQHYEKIVLGVLLLSFVFAMIYLLQMVGSARDVTLKDLKFSAPASKYESVDFKSKEFEADYILGTRGVWQGRAMDEKLGFSVELIAPVKTLRCSACQKMVPYTIVKEKLVCPICGEKLESPPEITESMTDFGGVDSDGDGMPDAYEDKMGFNKNDPSDASRDADNDGFSNLYEYLMGTDPHDPKSFPGPDKRIYIIRLLKVTLPIRLESVTEIADPNDKSSKKFWDISVTLNRQRSSVVIGEEITVANQRYKVVDAVYRKKDEQTSSVVVDLDDSSLFLEPVGGGERLEIKTGQRVFAPNHKAEIEDIANGRKYIVGVGDTFAVGDDQTVLATFQVTAIDAVKEHVTLLNQGSGAEVLMTRDIKIPPHARVNTGGRMSMEPGGMDMPVGVPPGVPRGQQRAPRNPRARN